MLFKCQVMAMLCCLSIYLFAQAKEKPHQQAPSEITVFTAKEIVTMDPMFPTGSAVAVKDGRILSVGSLETLQPWLKNTPYKIDKRFEKNVLFPGLIDPHMHPLLGALQLGTVWITPESWDISGNKIEATQSPKVYWQRLKEAIKKDENSGTPIFITWGWSEPEHGPMTRQMLDKLDTKKPIFIWQRSAHEGVFNTAALQWMKLSEKDIAPKYKETINYTDGHFLETGFFEVAVQHLAAYLLSPAFIDASFDKLNYYLIGNGITTTADMAFSVVDWDLETANYQRNLVDKNVPYRTVIVPDAYKLSLQKGGLEKAFAFIDKRLTQPSESPQLVYGKRIKMFSDGAIFSQLMQMHDPGYIDHHKGQWLTPPDVFLKQTRKYWNAGYRIHVHSNGDAGIDNTLNVLETLQNETPREPHSLVIEHYGYADERINRRTKNLRAAVSANPYYVHLLGDSYSKIGLGYDRAQRLVPLGGLVDHDVPVALHSDFGMAPAQPFVLAWAAATRQTVSGKSKVPPRALTVNEALKAITVDAAYILGLEKDIGSIQAGKKADFVVLDVNPQSVKAEKLKNIQVFGTVFEGRVSQR